MRNRSDAPMVNLIASQAKQFRQQNRAIAINQPAQSRAKWLLLSGLMLLTLLLSLPLLAAENLYEKNYRAQNTSGLVSMQANPDTQIYVSNHKDEDNISMLEKGYDMMGSSGFDAGDVSPQLALAHAKAIKADVVLVYSKYGSAQSADSKMSKLRDAAKQGKELTEKDLEEGPVVYKYFASYWAKLPNPILGVHIIKLIQKTSDQENTQDQSGLKILAVINNSPAAQAGLMRGDEILSINDIPLKQPEELSTTVRKFKGNNVTIAYKRNDEMLTTKAQLN
jgi:PDZ domain